MNELTSGVGSMAKAVYDEQAEQYGGFAEESYSWRFWNGLPSTDTSRTHIRLQPESLMRVAVRVGF